MAEWRRIAQTITTPATLDDPFIVTVPCPHRDQALEVAAWIVEEIQTNVESEAAQRIKQQNAYNAQEAMERWQREGESLNSVQRLARGMARPKFIQIERLSHRAALASWALLVREGGVWDHKPDFHKGGKKGDEFDSRGVSAYPWHHKYQGYEYFYDIWSNIHYGYVGRYIGFSEQTLLDGVGLAQYLVDRMKSDVSPTDRSEVNGEGYRRFDDVTDHLSVSLGIALFERFTPQQLTGSLLMSEVAQVDYPEERGSKISHSCQGARKRKEEYEQSMQREAELQSRRKATN